MNGTREPNKTVAGAGELDPRDAARLLDQTRRRAQRQFDRRPPALMLTAAVVVLIAYGAAWLSVRGQHPYAGPSAVALVVLYSTVAVWAIIVAAVYRRATAGVRGRSAQKRRAEALTFGTIWIAVYVFQGALHHAGASHAIVYGIYPAVAPALIVGAAAAAHQAARENWGIAAFASGAVALAAGAAFAGPSAVWAVMGVGLSVLLAGRAGFEIARSRGS
jgi:hypothetical protein